MSISSFILPIILGIFGLGCVLMKGDVQSAFINGAEDGIKGAFGIMPTLILLMTSTSLFFASGACDIISEILRPLMSKLGIPSELTPLIIVRPLSGSGSTALLSQIFNNYGPDSFISKCASVMCGSSDTVFYITSVYLSAAGIKKSGYVIPCALFISFFGTVISCIAVNIFI